MNTRTVIVLALVFCSLAAPLVAGAQQPGALPRIGILLAGPISGRTHFVEALRQGLRELGYTEGQNILLEVRSPERGESYADLAAQLVRLKVQVIVAGGTPVVEGARSTTATTPIVIAGTIDPVGTGFVASLARPGGNVTGLSLMAPELAGKRLQLLEEVVPRASRVAILWNAGNPAPVLVVRETEAAARTLGVRLQILEIRTPKDIDRAFEAAIRGRASALIVVEDPFVNTHRARIVALAAKHRLPAMYGQREFVDAGGLMSYAANLPEVWRRAATYVDKILKGAKPADLPVEQPTRFELVVNLKTAKALRLTIPPSVLIRADQVIQ